MSTSARRLALGVLVLAGMLLNRAPVSAQFRFSPNPAQNVNNPYYLAANGISQAQYLANIQAYARAAQMQTWMYQQPVVQTPWANPIFNPAAAYGPQIANPYTPVAPAYPSTGTNPYLPNPSPYDPSYSNPYSYYVDPVGGALRGYADVVRANGTYMINSEQARQAREQYNQAKLDTKKKKFDLEMYIKANTPTFTEEQAKVARMTLKRIQSNSTPSEIVNGKALNFLLNDVARFPVKKSGTDPIPMAGDVLIHLNVTKTFGSIGLLRDQGKFTWPEALEELLPAEQRKAVEAQAQTLVKGAQKGKADANILKDLRNELDRIRDLLGKKINEIPTTGYLDAKRFLNDFDEARIALERGEATTQFEFQKYVVGGRTVQEVADYLIARGLKFASACQSDEASYRAMHSAMVALDIALNAQNGYSDEQPIPKD